MTVYKGEVGMFRHNTLKLRKIAVVLVIAMAMVLQMASVSMAEETRNKISQITLTVDIQEWEDEEIEVTSPYGFFDVTDCYVSNMGTSAATVKVDIEADEDYYFTNLRSSNVTLRGDSAEFSSSSITDNKTKATITIKVKKPGSKEKEKEKEDKNKETNKRENTQVSDAHIHYYNGTHIATYPANVPSQNSASPNGNGIPDPFKEQNKNAVQAKPGWNMDAKGWWYMNPDGTYPSKGWVEVNKKWYCFDDKGYMRTGWVNVGDHWYYCDESMSENRGQMWTNTRTPDGYYVNERGLYIPGM